MKIEFNVPDRVECAHGVYEPTGEYRTPATGEFYLSDTNTILQQNVDVFDRVLRPIYHKVWVWPAYLNGWGFAMDQNGYIWWFEHPAEMETIRWMPSKGYTMPLAKLTTAIKLSPPTFIDWTTPVLNPNYKS